jgi:prophage antirepressor-like protein
MDIVKSFVLNESEYHVTIKGTHEHPLFRSSDIADVLEIKHIRSHLSAFSDKHKKTIPIETAGGIQNVSFLTESGLYKLIMRSNKPIAEKFQDWVSDIVHDIRTTGQYKLDTVQQTNETLKSQILALEEELAKRSARKRRTYDAGETVYLVQILDGVFKVGSSINMSQRANQYYTHGTGRIVYTKRCKNCSLLEKVMHHVFAEHQYGGRCDWFTVDFESLRAELDAQQASMDKTESAFSIDTEALNAPAQSMEDPTQHVEPAPEPEDQPEDEQSDVQEAPPPPPPSPLPPPPPPAFDKFLQECYDIAPDAKASWNEMSSRYRIWARSTEKNLPELAAFLKARGFKETFLYDPETRISSTAYAGLQMRPLAPIPRPNGSDQVASFAYDACVNRATGRLSSKALHKAFVEWKQRRDPSYVSYKPSDKKSVNEYFQKNYLAAVVHDGQRTLFGFYGVCLKGDQSTGLKSKPKNRKNVEQVHPSTNEVMAVYDSITHAANEIGVSISAISVAISSRRMCKGFYFQVQTS